MTPFLRKILGLSPVLTLAMFALLVFGVFMIESAARHLPVAADDLAKYGSAGALYAHQQKQWIILGSIAYFAAAFTDYRWIRWTALPFYAVSLVLMGLAVARDDEVHRLTIAGLSFQPAQLGVCSGILMISWLIQDPQRLHPWFGRPLVKIATILGTAAIPFLMVMKMGDMGSALVWIPVTGVALLVGGVPLLHLSFMALGAVGLLPLLYFIALPLVSERGPERIDTWLRMARGKEVDITSEAYAAYNVQTVIGKAGWRGIGWNADAAKGSLHAKGMIPQDTAHNDYIFAVIAEETGFRGSLLMLGVFAALLVTCLAIAAQGRDAAGRMLPCLVAALFFAHVFESVGMCVGLTPITGIPMPLVSYSGTFVLICMFLLGMTQSVWIHRELGPAEESPAP
jgi:rod shape determining protein RodA